MKLFSIILAILVALTALPALTATMMSPMMFVTTVGKPLMWVSAVLIATLSITIIISSIVAFVFIWNTKYSAACWSLVVPLAQVLLIALIFVIM